MDGSQDLLDAFSARLGVFTWESAVSVKDLLRETLRQSIAQRVTPADPNIIEAMMYGRRVAEVTTSFLTSDAVQVFCERLQAERVYVAEAYAVYMEAEAERRRQEATAAAAARPQPAPVPQGPWPPPPGVAASSQPLPAHRKAHFSPGPRAERAPFAAAPPLGERQRRVTLYRPQPRQMGAQPPPRPLRGSCLRTTRPVARGLECGRAAARVPVVPWRHGGTGGGEGQGSALPRGRAHPREPLHGRLFAGAGQGECRKDPRAFAAEARGDAAGGLGTAAARLAPAFSGSGPGSRARTGAGPAGPCVDRGSVLAPVGPVEASPVRLAGGPLAFPAAGALAHGGFTGGGHAGGAFPAGQAPPAAGDPGATAGPEAPTAGGTLDQSQQRQLGFEHRLFGAGDSKGNSWSEKMNVWTTFVIANEERDRRLRWDTSQEGGL